MKILKNTMGIIRAPFLLLTPVCVLLGASISYWRKGDISLFHLLIALIGALCAHISVNAFNEYFDYKSGLDLKTIKTPFSGGSGTLPSNPHFVRYSLFIAILSFLITFSVGIYFLFLWGIAILPLGVSGLILVFFYTRWLTKNPFLCLLAPGLGFGTFMVMGTDFVLTGSYSIEAFIASLIPFFLVSDLLLLNQFPDIQADKSVGRRHIPIVFGPKKSSFLYALFLLFAFLSIIIGIQTKLLPELTLLGMLTIPLAAMATYGAVKYAKDIPKLIPYMGINVLVILITPVLISIGLFFTKH